MGTLTIDSSITGPLFITILVFVLVIGSMFSMSVLRFFQQRRRAGTLFLTSSAVSLGIFIYVINMLT